MRRAALVVAFTVAAGACGPREVPAFSNDPLSVRQGHMAAVGVARAWRVTRGGGVVVAVVDNGTDTAHPDLAEQLWTNPREVPGNGVDDDRDGFVDDVHGWDLVTHTGDVSPRDGAGLDAARWGHGTAAAGLVAARTDNGVGVAGCCPDCRVMTLRARDFRGERTVVPRLVAAIGYAVGHGARVVSVSDGVPRGALSPDEVRALEDAVRRARAAGTLVVASAGNDGADAVRWPARAAGVVAVAAVDWDGRPTPWTSYGAEVAVAAPGEDAFTTLAGGAYDDFDGTSASAPIVAALAALLFAAHPSWSPDDIEARIRATARPASTDDRPELAGRFGAGVVDFAAALDPDRR